MNELSAKRVSGPLIRLHPEDNVVVALSDIAIGTALDCDGPDGARISSRSQVPAGYKIAARRIRQGEAVCKDDVVIGFAAVDIEPGTMVHNHNMDFREFDRDHALASEYRPVQKVAPAQQAHFDGIVRADGRVATRNYIGLLSTVNCSATVVRRIAAWFTPERLAAYQNVDGVVAFSHSIGCGMEMRGEPMALLRRTIAGYARHPNLAGVLVVGLGCERNSLQGLMEESRLQPGPQLHTFVMQDSGGTRQTIEAGVAAVQAMLPGANGVRRQRVPASHLKVGLQCGGRDGFYPSPPTLRWARRWTCWCATAAPPSCPRRPRSTAWNTR